MNTTFQNECEYERENASMALSDGMAWDEDWDEDRIENCDEWDLNYHFGSDWIFLKKREVLVYVLGAIVTAAIILHLHTVLAYPFSFPLNPGESTSNAETTAVFIVICLVTSIVNMMMIATSMRSLTFLDGGLSVYAALGIYLFPHLTLHLPFLIACIDLGVVLALFDYSIEFITPSFLKVAWFAIVNTAYICALIVNLCSAGFLPMTTAKPTPAMSDAELTQALESFFNKASLSDMSHQEIADALQTVVHVECKRLGLLDNEPKVFIGFAGTALAGYIADGNKIVFNPATLSGDNDPTGYDAVEIVTHEMAHAYQRAVVDGDIAGLGNGPLGTVTQDDVRQWKEEFDKAADPNKDMIAYWYQDIELRARDYALHETIALSGMVAGHQTLVL